MSEWARVLSSAVRRARVEHRCWVCWMPILPAESYRREFLVHRGQHRSVAICSACFPLVDEIRADGGHGLDPEVIVAWAADREGGDDLGARCFALRVRRAAAARPRPAPVGWPPALGERGPGARSAGARRACSECRARIDEGGAAGPLPGHDCMTVSTDLTDTTDTTGEQK